MLPQAPVSLASRWWFRIAIVAALSLTCVVAYALYRGVRNAYRSNNFLDRMLGCEGVLGVEESGFYGVEESNGEPFRWTNGVAKLMVPTRGAAPQALTVLLGLGVPKAIRLLIQANRQSLFDQQVAPQDNWIATFSLDSVPMGKDTVMNAIRLSVVSFAS